MIHRSLTIPCTVFGDILTLIVALFCALFLRSQALPHAEFFAAHTLPFAILLLASILVYYSSGLYDLSIFISKKKIITRFLYAHTGNTAIAIILFYFISVWGITPKTTLLLYTLISLPLFVLWRLFLLPKIIEAIPKEEALLIGRGDEATALYEVLSHEAPYPFSITEMFLVPEYTESEKLEESFVTYIEQTVPTTIIVDLRHAEIAALAPFFYELASSGVRILPFTDVYEEVFNHIPPSSLADGDILSHMYSKSHSYDIVKRGIDIAITVPLLCAAIPLFVIAYIGIKFQDGGAVLLRNNIRIGKGGARMHLYKFRTMKYDDTGKWLTESDNINTVTPFGYFLRKTRIDQLPELVNVLKGDISLIGPRPDIVDLGERLAREIPLYKARLVATPGLSGWAQTHMKKPPQSVEETKERLLYDMYYIKHRSPMLDILIALKTIQTLISREGM